MSSHSKTQSPSLKPTTLPTAKPTTLPTANPTTLPTAKPTTFPTAKPSEKPTPNPSLLPTSRPSPKPSRQKTAPPSSHEPTLRPSHVPSESGFRPVRINCGGDLYTDREGNDWSGDADLLYFNGGGTANTILNIFNTNDVPLYQSERSGSFLYEIPVPEGDYEIYFHFAEIDGVNSSPGSRVFQIIAEEATVFESIDIVALSGSSLTALTLSTTAIVTDGYLSIKFESVSGADPKLSALLVRLNKPHVAHAVAGGPYVGVDVDNDGSAIVEVDGTLSHTHGLGLSLVSWHWEDEDSKVIGSGNKTSILLAVGEHIVTLVVKDDDGNEASESAIVSVFPFGYPVLYSVSPDRGDITGNVSVTLFGHGFDYQPEDLVVRFGFYNLTGASDIQVLNATAIVIPSIPTSALAIPVTVSVTTPSGTSNPSLFTYENGITIDFSRGILFELYAPTTLAFGPNPNQLFVGTADGKIAALTLNEELDKVVESIISAVVSPDRVILGIAFDPMNTSPLASDQKVYFSHNKPFHGEGKSSSGEAINARISVATGPNLDVIEEIITGLPCSDHDHGVYGLEFGDFGELYFNVAGNTNGGIPGALSGTHKHKENVLSAATLVAYLSDPSFDGTITYDADDDGNVVSGYGVEVFASGNRSPYDLVLHSNGLLYGTDNGPNLSYGRMSSSCTSSISDVYEKDKLNLLEKDGYYGHPNPKRGETDPRQCKWRSAYEQSDDEYNAPIAVLESSSDGIIEWHSNHFGGLLRGNLILSQYKGNLFRVVLTPDGKAVRPESNPPPILHSDGGLDVTQGPNGNLYILKYKGEKVRLLQPLEPSSTALAVNSVYPRRGGFAGGNVLHIYGNNFNDEARISVDVGGKDCSLISISKKRDQLHFTRWVGSDRHNCHKRRR